MRLKYPGFLNFGVVGGSVAVQYEFITSFFYSNACGGGQTTKAFSEEGWGVLIL